MKTILYATDFSDNSISALKYAYALSCKTNSNLWVIHIFNHTTLSADIRDLYLLPKEESIKQKNAKLKEFCVKYLGSDYNSLNIKVDAIENNNIVNGIISKAEKSHTSMIVVGMKGESTFVDFILGSTTTQLIEKAPYPIIAVPANISLNELLKTVVYATDYEEEDIRAISKLVEIVAPFNSTIHITHISTKKEYEAYQQMEWFKELMLTKIDYKNLEYYIFFEEDICNSLCRHSNEVQADLIVMLERKKNGLFENIFHQDLVKKMKDHTAIPLMSFNEINY
ncbi:MAG: universal stress protein [Bacteroidetes bacterium]|nr:universal stress protein [Bacteroidota bacterium]